MARMMRIVRIKGILRFIYRILVVGSRLYLESFCGLSLFAALQGLHNGTGQSPEPAFLGFLLPKLGIFAKVSYMMQIYEWRAPLC